MVGVEQLRQEGPQGDGRGVDLLAEDAAQGAQGGVDLLGGQLLGEGQSLGVLQLPTGGGYWTEGQRGGILSHDGLRVRAGCTYPHPSPRGRLLRPKGKKGCHLRLPSVPFTWPRASSQAALSGVDTCQV